MRIERHRLELDLTPEGEFRTPPTPSWGARIVRAALVVAVIAAGLALASLALWFALILIPIALIAGLIGWGAIRFQIWRDGSGPFARR